MPYTIQSERLTPEDYIAFLKTTDLGSQYPQERFEERIARLVRNAPISLTARDGEGVLAGVCFGITDFAYWLFLTDLGVARTCTGQGLGRRLVQAALEAAGGRKRHPHVHPAQRPGRPLLRKAGDGKIQGNHGI